MKVLVKYSGILAEIAGLEYEYVEIPDNSTITTLLEAISRRNTNLGNWIKLLPLLHVYVNDVEVTGLSEYRLKEGDKVVLMTPLYEGG